MPPLEDYITMCVCDHIWLYPNAQFDRNAFIFTSKRHYIEMHDMNWECLMKAYAQYRNEHNQYGSPKWHKLNEACRQQGIEIIQSHRALGDAWAAYELMKSIAKNR
jgi:DNA polymerase III epsilon subunit-like protein